MKFLLGLIIGFILALPVEYDTTEIKIIKKYQPEIIYKYKKEFVYKNPEILTQCFDSPIIVDLKINKNFVDITAQDRCKKTKQRFDIKIKSEGNWKYYTGFSLLGGALVYAAMR